MDGQGESAAAKDRPGLKTWPYKQSPNPM